MAEHSTHRRTELKELFAYPMPMKVCIVGQQGVLSKKYYCRDADMVNVYVRNGFVVMPGAQNGAPIRLVKSTLGMTGTKTMSRRPTQIGFDYDGERFSIWSVGRERVASSQHVNHDGHIILYFSDHNCLIKKYGIMHLGENNGKVFQVDDKKPVDNVSKEKSGIGEDVKKARSGWMIWAIFWGFLTGSLVAVIIGGLLLYFARRTAYADWYRGMYKRYGCDASGVSGGVTGSQFGSTTTGGNTMSTIGSTTAGTTGGSSTMGTTGGSTMGRETGGGSTMGTTGTEGTTGGTTGGGTTGGTTGDMVTM
ncbi:hypothetical protein ANCCEY_03936 [Ancylostoma ceylanicum]|uniref:Uncharacterized protein n=2 Tax=Ancylostoma ceylanicum TaxID=53326 RepID=A0A0D6M0H0_9BILA|nr:hypothetical protein ANCCEY_03936 [Ancylostoma ceylanicum]